MNVKWDVMSLGAEEWQLHACSCGESRCTEVEMFMLGFNGWGSQAHVTQTDNCTLRSCPLITRAFKNLCLRASLDATWSTKSVFGYVFRQPKHTFSQNTVKSWFKDLRTWARLSKCGTWVSGSCRPSCKVAEQNQSFEILALKLPQLFWKSPNLEKLF